MKKLFVTLLSFILITSGAFYAQSQKPIDIDLWENGLPNTNGQDHLPADESKGNFKPSIRVFLPNTDIATGRAVVICPGGGYQNLAYHHEGYDWAPYFNKQGIAAIVLKYRMPKGVNKDVPYSDVEEAMRLVKANAKEWNINTNDVGIMGSSAGGHLASTIATKAKPEVRPAFQILFYPVISMEDGAAHGGSRKNLLGENPSQELIDLYSGHKQVTENTPRAFIVFSDDDGSVSPVNGTLYYAALKEKNIPASLYIWPTGGHGWSIREDFLYKNEMLNELSAWLRSF